MKNCPNCHASQVRTIAVIASSDQLTVTQRQCNDCGYVFTDSRRTPEFAITGGVI